MNVLKVLVAGVLLAGFATAAGAAGPSGNARADAQSQQGYQRAYGVLHAVPQYQSLDQQAGIRLFVVSINWRDWEPSLGSFSTAYIDSIKKLAQGYVDAGDIVVADVGLQYPPAWVSTLTNGALKDQNGNVARLAPNYEFSATVQAAETTYITNVAQTLGSRVSQYRLGLGVNGEMDFPPGASADPAGTWWIGSADTDVPAAVGANPMPGWTPGSSTWNGSTVTVADAQNWYDWYLHALENGLTVEGNAFRDAGFTGQLALLSPGVGVLPALYKSRINALLGNPDGADFYGTMNTGTAYQYTIPYLIKHVRGPLIVDGTGGGDSSGASGQINCQPGDERVNAAPGSTAMSGWSSIRWTHALAAQNGLRYELENATFNSSITYVFGLFLSCHAQYLLWLNDESLEGGFRSGHVQLAYQNSGSVDPFNEPTYASEIKRNPLPHS